MKQQRRFDGFDGFCGQHVIEFKFLRPRGEEAANSRVAYRGYVNGTRLRKVGANLREVRAVNGGYAVEYGGGYPQPYQVVTKGQEETRIRHHHDDAAPARR